MANITLNAELIDFRLRQLETLANNNRDKINELLLIATRLEESMKSAARTTGGVTGSITGAITGVVIGALSYFWGKP